MMDISIIFWFQQWLIRTRTDFANLKQR